MRGAKTFYAAIAAGAALWACGEAGDSTRDKELPGREREHPDWSTPEEEVAPSTGAARIDEGGVEKSGGVWLFPVDVSIAASLSKESARAVAASMEMARRGDDVAFAKKNLEYLRVKSTLEQILLHGDSVPRSLRASIERYLLGFYVHHGSVPSAGCGARINAAGLLRPDFIPGELLSAMEIAARNGAVFDIPKSSALLGADRLQELEALMAAIRPIVFGRFIGRGDPDAADAGVTARNADPSSVDSTVAVPPSEVAALIDALRRDGTARGLVSKSTKTNDLQLVAGEVGTACIIGLDATEREGSLRALVGVPDKEAQKALDAVFSKGQALDKTVRSAGGTKSVTEASAFRAKPRAVLALYAAGSLGPLFEDGSLWRMVDGPSVRVGDEVWFLVNVAASFDASFGAKLVRGLANDADSAERRLRYRAKSRLAFNALRETAGRGTDGTETRSQEWIANHLGEYAPLLAAMRADLAALHLAFDPSVRETGLIEGDEAARALFEDYVGWSFESFGFGAPPADMKSAAEARRAVVRNLVAQNAVIVKGGDGTPLTYSLSDLAAARTSIAALLAEVRRIRFVGDARAAAALIDTLEGSEARWQRDVETRFRKLEKPRAVGFFFAPIFSSTDADGAVERLTAGSEKTFVSARTASLARSQP